MERLFTPPTLALPFALLRRPKLAKFSQHHQPRDRASRCAFSKGTPLGIGHLISHSLPKGYLRNRKSHAPALHYTDQSVELRPAQRQPSVGHETYRPRGT